MLKIKKLVVFLLAAAAMTAVSACTAGSVPEVTGDMITEVLSTGKSDAIIIRTENHTVLIDCGETNDGDEVVEYLQENGIDSVDYMFITHFDKDHVGGAAEVIENISVDKIVTPNYEGTNSEYESFVAAAETADLDITRLTASAYFTLDDCLFEVYPPLKSQYDEEDNDYSLAIKVTHGEDTLLFTGDAETERLKEIERQTEVAADFLKVPHHGRIDAESENFIKSVSPAYAVITCSKKEGAEEELLAILEEVGAEVYLNRDGDITVISTGKGIAVVQ